MKWQWPWVRRADLEELRATWYEERARLSEDLRKAVRESEWFKTQVTAANDRLYEAGAASRAESDRHERDMVRSEARYAELMASYRMLKLQGAHEPVAIPTLPEPKVDPVMAAVNAKAPDAKTRASMLRQVERDRKAELSDEEIIMRINRGNRPAEEVQ